MTNQNTVVVTTPKYQMYHSKIWYYFDLYSVETKLLHLRKE